MQTPAEVAVSRRRPRTKRREVLELVVGYGLILAVIWTPRPWQRVLYGIAVLALGAMIATGFESWEAMGLRRRNLLRSLWIVPVAGIAAAGFVVWAVHAGTLRRTHTVGWFVARYWGYVIWSLVQQILLQDFFLGRFLRLLPGRPVGALWAAAGIFAAAHLPNPVLTPLTLLWGAVACALFLRYRNLWPVAMAHALLGITLATTMPAPVIRNMRVGLGYLTYPRTHRGMVRGAGPSGGRE